ncbi:MAG: hypothetical protein M3N15_02980 [Actinomycetota bacterium]|nr:hypothetical protein [Actinomycetota bacterium]
MKYMLLICENRSLPERDEAAETRLMAEYGTFTRDIIDSGELVAGEQLQRPDTATPGQIDATLVGFLGDFDLAEDALQEATIAALERWPSHGLPDNPGA